MKSIVSSNLAFAVDFGILAFFTEILKIYYLVSAAIGFIVGTSISYTISILWIFNKRVFRYKTLEYGLFVLIGVIGLGANELLIWFFTERIHIHYLLSKIVAGAIVFFFNFFSRKYILFT